MLCALLVLLAAPVDAQRSTQPKHARFRGIVLDASTAKPVVGTRIAVVGTGRVAVSDSLGVFDLDSLPAGINRFVVFAVGFPRSNLTLPFAAGEVMERTLELDSTQVNLDSAAAAAAAAQPIAGVTVNAPVPMERRYADFERRMRTGRGQYLTREQIEKAGFNRLTDAMRQVRGAIVECGGGGGCFIRMARAPRGCLPEYIVDGVENNSFGLNTPILDIEGIEVYTGAADVPGEFAGRNAGCGVIVIWTKVAPKRR
ncbi:MAG: carboxypeptidase-like regulatory domain-containing protein [Gemmatimonadaceae bacterium]